MIIKKAIFKIFITVCTIFLLGCSSLATRENNPDQFDLLRTGQIKKANVLRFKDCLIQGSEVKNRIAYNVNTRHHVRNDSHRVESYAGEKLLLLSIDILSSGKTQLLRAKNSSLTDLSTQINAFDNCLAIHR